MAGRSPQPWYRKAKGAWYVHLGGKTVRLGKDRDAAFRAFHRLMAEEGRTELLPGPSLTVEQVVREYLADLRPRVRPRTHYVAGCYLKPFLARLGTLRVRDLRKQHIERAVREHGRWNPTSESHVKDRLLAVFNWAVRRELVPANPLKGLSKPRARSRGTAALVSAEAHLRLTAAAPDYLRDVLLALHQTGARPGEVLAVTARDFDAERGVWVLRRHKTEHEAGGPRVVFLTPEVAGLCRRLAERHPEGPLFRTRRGKPFPEGYYLGRLVRNLCKKLNLVGVIPYGYRHTFATDALANGVPDAQVAELLGHSGTGMLHRHYSHLTARARVLREALGQVRPEPAPRVPPSPPGQPEV